MDEDTNLFKTAHAKSAQVQWWFRRIPKVACQNSPAQDRRKWVCRAESCTKREAELSSVCEGCGYRNSMFPLFFQIPIPMSSHVVLKAESES